MYADSPYRRRMQQAPKATPPVSIAKWCELDPKREPPLPVEAVELSDRLDERLLRADQMSDVGRVEGPAQDSSVRTFVPS